MARQVQVLAGLRLRLVRRLQRGVQDLREGIVPCVQRGGTLGEVVQPLDVLARDKRVAAALHEFGLHRQPEEKRVHAGGAYRRLADVAGQAAQAGQERRRARQRRERCIVRQPDRRDDVRDAEGLLEVDAVPGERVGRGGSEHARVLLRDPRIDRGAVADVHAVAVHGVHHRRGRPQLAGSITASAKSGSISSSSRSMARAVAAVTAPVSAR